MSHRDPFVLLDKVREHINGRDKRIDEQEEEITNLKSWQRRAVAILAEDSRKMDTTVVEIVDELIAEAGGK